MNRPTNRKPADMTRFRIREKDGSETTFGYSKRFVEWLEESLGISTRLLDSLATDDDWTFVIKVHGITEAGVNHLLVKHLNNTKLAAVIPRLETNDRRRGKIAFIKAYDLLPDHAILFIRVLSEIRNAAVHDIKTFDLDLLQYVRSLAKEQLKNWRVALGSTPFGRPIAVRDFPLELIKGEIFDRCIAFMVAVLRHEEQSPDHPSRNLEPRSRMLVQYKRRPLSSKGRGQRDRP